MSKRTSPSQSSTPEPPSKRLKDDEDEDFSSEDLECINEFISDFHLLALNSNEKRLISLGLYFQIFATALQETSIKDRFVKKIDAEEGISLAKLLEQAEQERVARSLSEGNWHLLLQPNYLRLFEKQDLDPIDPLYTEIEYRMSRLAEAYSTPYIGTAARDFIGYIRDIEAGHIYQNVAIYSKSISVVQSSGTGKSRMLTEVGKSVFTIPICLRSQRGSGFPVGDVDVYAYLKSIEERGGFSVSGHHKLANFICALYQHTLSCLQKIETDEKLECAEKLRDRWHELMETGPNGSSDYRKDFFKVVINNAESKGVIEAGDISRPGSEEKIVQLVEQVYSCSGAKQAIDNLMSYLHTKGDNLCITYMDEAAELGDKLSMLTHLLSLSRSVAIWFVFMATKPLVSYLVPAMEEPPSPWSCGKRFKPLPPYISLGFDQVATKSATKKVSKVGELSSLRHLSQYGRPMWFLQFEEGEESELLEFAIEKLTVVRGYRKGDRDQVFALLSQRVCLEPIMAVSEARSLANRSVSHHMRLLTGFSGAPYVFYTHPSSEPILALAAAEILNNMGKNKWGEILNTFIRDLCNAGLVEKGPLGELAARILLIIARDYASPTMRENGRQKQNLLEPVPLNTVLESLFGSDTPGWADNEGQKKLLEAFENVYVNFTHWIVARDPLPRDVNQDLLANLWARGAALQCCLTQEAIDLMVVTYSGSIAKNDIFDPKLLSTAVFQIKYTATSDTKAGEDIRPFGIPRDIVSDPPPYLAILMELGNRSVHQQTKSLFRLEIPPCNRRKDILRLRKAWLKAEEELDTCLRDSRRSEDIELKRAEVAKKQRETDRYNRYLISVRGASSAAYRILKTANIETEFEDLLAATIPSPRERDYVNRSMRPLERLDSGSGYTAWMSTYYKPIPGGN